MAEQDPTKFNTSKLIAFRNGDKDNPKELCFGAYNGNIQLSIRNVKFEEGDRPRSISISPQIGYLITESLKDLVEAPQPGKKNTLIFNGKWNKDTRRRELSFQFTIGMDDAAMCYIGIKHVDYNNDQYSGRFDLTGDRNIEVSGIYDDDKNRSFQTLKMLYKYFNDMFLQQASLLTRNHLQTPKFGNKGGGRGGDSGARSVNNVSAPTADDEFF